MHYNWAEFFYLQVVWYQICHFRAKKIKTSLIQVLWNSKEGILKDFKMEYFAFFIQNLAGFQDELNKSFYKR